MTAADGSGGDTPALRAEADRDSTAIHALHVAAFGQVDEADLVDRLRAEGAVRVSVVAEAAVANGKIFGHVLFSALETDRPCMALALAPLAVLPECQKQGIGAALVRAGLARCRAEGVDLVVVLGDPAYYRRFGFSSALGRRLCAPFEGDALMALELRPGALSEGLTRIRYAKAFGIV